MKWDLVQPEPAGEHGRGDGILVVLLHVVGVHVVVVDRDHQSEASLRGEPPVGLVSVLSRNECSAGSPFQPGSEVPPDCEPPFGPAQAGCFVLVRLVVILHSRGR